MAYKLAIFDLDGTLLNTIADLGTSVNLALAAKGLPQHEIEAYKMMVGHGMRNLVRNASPEALKDDPAVQEPLLEQFFVEYGKHIADRTEPYPGIVRMLGNLNSAGVRLAVASNKFQQGTQTLIGMMFPQIPFTDVLGNKPGAPLKPDPEVVDIIMANAGVTTSETVMVGDSGTDIKTANAAGIDCIAVSWGFRPKAELEAACKTVVDNAQELEEAILCKRG